MNKDLETIIDREIHRYLMDHDVKTCGKGFYYLVSAIKKGLDNFTNIYNIMKLYEEIAEEYNKNTSNIERSIRYLIKTTGATNKEFISTAVYRIACKIFTPDKEHDISKAS